jgi:hypothetical protein
MADALSTYTIMIGVFVAFAAVLFASRARRYAHGFTPAGKESESER